MSAHEPTARRSFLSRLLALGAAVGLAAPAAAGAASRGADDDRGATVAEDPWMQRLRGRHRVLFHSHLATEGLALRWAQTYLDTQRVSYGVADDDCGVVVGLNGRSIGLLFNDALWAKYPIGETLQMPGVSNAQRTLVAQLIGRGVIVLACENSLRASGQRFLPAAERGDAARRTAFYEEARANLLPGVEVVPSMVVTLQQAQDRGCRYVYAGS